MSFCSEDRENVEQNLLGFDKDYNITKKLNILCGFKYNIIGSLLTPLFAYCYARYYPFGSVLLNIYLAIFHSPSTFSNTKSSLFASGTSIPFA